MFVSKILVAAIFALAPALAAAQACHDDHQVRISCETGKVWDEKAQGCVTVSG